MKWKFYTAFLLIFIYIYSMKVEEKLKRQQKDIDDLLQTFEELIQPQTPPQQPKQPKQPTKQTYII